MKFTAIFAALVAFAVPQAVPAQAATLYPVTYSVDYRLGNASLDTVACSNGANGLVTKGYTDFESLPTYPNVSGIPNLVWNSTLCGTCWELSYLFPNGTVNTVVVTAIDAAFDFNLSPQAFGYLVGEAGYIAGEVTANVTQLNATSCGF
ncbi:Cerato-platanin [Pisolithus croceorrhizus]|nr:Cerato-platanin [Pisolithus croceorrhizus]KAI6166525.1 Cerato-platanin [Pisolithus thermaeus]